MSDPTNEQELREQVSAAMYDTDYKQVTEEPDYFDKAAVDAVVELIQAHTNAEIAKVLDRIEIHTDNGMWLNEAIQAERAKLKEVK